MAVRAVSFNRSGRPTLEGAGVRLDRAFGNGDEKLFDPFLMLDDFRNDDPEMYRRGFPWHPHRGIETITYVLEGEVDHGDSMGNQGTIGAGDVQWMTAGRGILHEEMPKLGKRRLDGFQIWVNLPAKLKMTKPRYQDVPAARIPEVARPDGARVRVVAGRVDGTDGAVREIFADPTYLDVVLPGGGTFEQPVPAGHTALLYVYGGEVRLGRAGRDEGPAVAATRLAILGDGDFVRVHAGPAGARFLLLSAQPLREPAVRWGPFVMNTREEVAQALQELRDGTFIKKA